MTCIIAHRSGWMVADRRVTFGDTLIGPYQRDKIVKGCGLLVGVFGKGAVGDRIAESLRPYPIDPAIGTVAEHAKNGLEVVRVMMRHEGEGSGALVVTPDGLVLFDQYGTKNRIDADVWACGSGYQAALGWLHGRFLGASIEPKDAQNAISFASALNSDIGDGFQVERL